MKHLKSFRPPSHFRCLKTLLCLNSWSCHWIQIVVMLMFKRSSSGIDTSPLRDWINYLHDRFFPRSLTLDMAASSISESCLLELQAQSCRWDYHAKDLHHCPCASQASSPQHCRGTRGQCKLHNSPGCDSRLSPSCDGNEAMQSTLRQAKVKCITDRKVEMANSSSQFLLVKRRHNTGGHFCTVIMRVHCKLTSSKWGDQQCWPSCHYSPPQSLCLGAPHHNLRRPPLQVCSIHCPSPSTCLHI